MDKENCVPKLIGGDVELGNFLLGENDPCEKSDALASRLLLSEVDGLPLQTQQELYGWHYGGNNPQDRGRKYLASNGGCIYIDLNHLELATPEVLSARDYQAVWTAMLRIARQAQAAVNECLEPERKVVVLANNSDRAGNSYGAHQSFLMSREAWDNMFRVRMIPSLFFLMAHQVSSIVYTGQGKAGSENGRPGVPYQISQRADFIESLVGEQTTYNRPLVNSRDEPLCGPRSGFSKATLPGDRYARLHVIFYDSNLAPVATFLKVGVMQLILTMIEAGAVDNRLILRDPLAALQRWSRDPDLTRTAPLLSGRRLTAVQLQFRFLELAKKFAASHGFEEYVAGSERILALWEDTLVKLEQQEFALLRGRVDWIMKRTLLEQALGEHPAWSWSSPELTYLDQVYSGIDPADSLFLALCGEGLFEPVASEREIDGFVHNPPEDTRAWTRALVLRAAGPGRVHKVDWDEIELRSPGSLSERLCVGLPDPLAATRSLTADLVPGDPDLDTLLRILSDAGNLFRPADSYTWSSATSLLDAEVTTTSSLNNGADTHER